MSQLFFKTTASTSGNKVVSLPLNRDFCVSSLCSLLFSLFVISASASEASTQYAGVSNKMPQLYSSETILSHPPEQNNCIVEQHSRDCKYFLKC